MPKMKSHKGARKRFRATATGKVKRSKASKRHLNSHKSAKRKMRLRRPAVETGRWGSKYLKALG